jgi:hypothetical protein
MTEKKERSNAKNKLTIKIIIPHMKNFKKKSMAVVLAIFFVLATLGLTGPTAALAITTPSLGAAATYGVLASTYTNTTVTTINGDVGFTIPPATVPLGTHPHYGSGVPYAAAGANQSTALAALATAGCTFVFAPGAINLSTDTTHGTIGVYTPGVYCGTGAMNIGGPLNLNGGGTYIFRPDGALTSTTGSIVTLTGASACDVFWTPTAATTLAANTTFIGTIIQPTSSAITVGANTVWTGQALAFGGTVTTDTDTITVPACAAATTTGNLHIIKQVINNNGGTATASLFNLHVKLSGIDVAGSPAAGLISPGRSYTLAPGAYAVSEDANVSYAQSFGGDCDSNGNITLAAGDNKTCVIINNDIGSTPGSGGESTIFTGLTQVQAGGSAPIVKAKWEANVDGYTDDSVAAGAQFNPTGVFNGNRTIKVCAIVTDPDGVADVKGVYADVYYPTGIAVGPSHVKLSTQDGSPTAGCGVLMQEDTLTKLSKADGISLFCNQVQQHNNNLPTFNSGYNYSEICKADGELMKETAYVACTDKVISYEDPAGDYKVTAVAQDASSLTGTLDNSFAYLPMTAFETDFTSVNYGNVKLDTHKIINGDLTWSPINAGPATVRNVGNTRFSLQVLEDDMGLGKTSGNWNVQYDGRVGSDATFVTYAPNVLTTLPNTLNLSEMNEVDFSIDVSKFPVNHSATWTGNITLSASSAAPLTCTE